VSAEKPAFRLSPNAAEGAGGPSSSGAAPAVASAPSYATVPEDCPCATVLEFLDRRFPRVGRDVWRGRLDGGKVLDDEGVALRSDTPCRPRIRLRYFREVREEPRVPFQEEILYHDEHILIACKPHFLPVIPSGPYVNECLVNRLRLRTGNPGVVPVNRLDRETAGLVMLSVNPQTRGRYGGLFQRGRVSKLYEAVATPPAEPAQREWTIRTRIVDGEPWFLSAEVEGEPNAKSRIRLLDLRDGRARFELEPLTGKRHQLRLHLNRIGSAIVNDPLYPVLRPFPKAGYDDPLQLLARRLSFRDPLSNRPMEFVSSRQLSLWEGTPRFPPQ
jgi:tRNA pseudouridine32 synthase/23S rRNA pseudouridine746 synthase